LFCNTHKTRGLYRDIKISEIDSFKLNISEYTPPVVQIIFKDIHESDYFIESPKGTDSKKLLDILNSLKTQVL